MITLRDILELNETVTLLELYVRRPDGSLITRSIIGQPYKLSSHQLDDMKRGRLEYIDIDINHYGRVGRSGMTQITYGMETYGMDWKAIPKKYLDAEVTDIHWIRERYGNERGSVFHGTIVPIQISMDCMSR